MPLLELFLSPSLDVVRADDPRTQLLLGEGGCTLVGVPLERLLVDVDFDLEDVRKTVAGLFEGSSGSSFETLDLAFRAPGAAEHASPQQDRSPLDCPHKQPQRSGFHLGSETCLACFVTLHLIASEGIVRLTAMEYSREHQKRCVFQEFVAWLVDECVNESIMAVKPGTGHVVFWNQNACNMYGYSKEEAIGTCVWEMVAPPEEHAKLKEEADAMKEGEDANRLTKLKRRDGSTFMALVHDAPIFDHDGNVDYMVGVSADETELNNVMTELKRLNQDLNKEVESRMSEIRVKEIEAEEQARMAKEALVRADATSQTMTMLSHELRTPLQGIMGVTSLSLLDYDPREGGTLAPEGPTYENLNTIMASSQLLLTLINNLLDSRKIETSMMDVIEMETFDLVAAINESLVYLKPLAVLHDVSFKLDMDPATTGGSTRGAWAKGAALRTQQIMVNLIGNAIKYSTSTRDRGKSVIEVKIRRSTATKATIEACTALCSEVQDVSGSLSLEDQGVLVVDVKDFGDGIPEDEAHKVFAAFAMLDKHRNKATGVAQPTGSGLGLNLCTTMIRRMGGHIWANNTDNGGSQFSFYLNSCSAEEERQQELTGLENKRRIGVGVPRSTVPVTLSPDMADKFYVMVVDDQKINVKVVHRLLTRLGVTHVQTSTCALQALDMLENDLGSVNLILTDVQMPVMDGIEFTQKVLELYESKGHEPPPVIIACTADYSDSTRLECAEAGASGLLRKPITAPNLSQFMTTSPAILPICALAA